LKANIIISKSGLHCLQKRKTVTALIADDLTITLSLKGMISYFTVTKPTREEWEDTPLENRVDSTFESPIWVLCSQKFLTSQW